MSAARRALAGGALAALALLGACGGAESQGRYAQVRGLRMYYEVHGHGPTLVLLHGGMGNGTQFAKQVPAFRSRHTLVIPDLCAQGRTTDRPGPLTYHDMAEDVIALLDQLHVRRFDVMGWSDGGIVGLDLAVHHPERIDHLVTFGANFTVEGLNASDVEWDRTATPASLGPQARLDYARLAPDSSDFEDAMGKILDMWRTQPNFTLDQLRSIRAKTMICAGEHDVVRPEHTALLAHTIPGARLWIVQGASHGAMLEQPALVNAHVEAFLAR